MERHARESLNHQRKYVIFQTPTTSASGNIDDTIKESIPQQPIPVVEIRDHMAEKNIVRSLSTKEDTEGRNVSEHSAFNDT
jgi:hypothetical protein